MGREEMSGKRAKEIWMDSTLMTYLGTLKVESCAHCRGRYNPGHM
jgi:hypothetical protein